MSARDLAKGLVWNTASSTPCGPWTQNRKLKMYMLVLLGVGHVSYQTLPQERAQRPRLEKHNMNQRTLARGIDSKALNKLKCKIWP